jgi:hypothetical protein
MERKILIVMIIVVFVFFCGQLTAEEVVGESIFPNIETPHPYPKAVEDNTLVWSTTIQEPGAAWIKIHFSEFRLNPGDFVILTDMKGKVIELIRGRDVARKRRSKFKVKKNDNKTVSFWGPAIDGDRVVVGLYSTSNEDNGLGFTIDEVGRGCKPILDRGLGPIYDTEEDVDIFLVPFCDSDPKIVQVTYREDTIDIFKNLLGKMIYRKGTTWFTCKGFLTAFGGIYIVPSEIAIHSQEVVDTFEVRFYWRHIDKDLYFTFHGDTFIDDYLSSHYGMLTIKTDYQMSPSISNGEPPGKNPDLSKIYAEPACYAYVDCGPGDNNATESVQNCPCTAFATVTCKDGRVLTNTDSCQ